MVKFNKKSHYPYTYGDDDGARLSDWAVSKLGDKRVRNHLGAVCMAIIALGSQAPTAQAIPTEYGEFATQATKEVAQQLPNVPKVTTEVPKLNTVVNQPNINNRPNLNVNAPIPAIRFPGPPTSKLGQYANTVVLGGSIFAICVNAMWGTPFMAVGCAGILISIGNKILGNS